MCIWLTLVHCKRGDLLYQVVFMLLQSTPACTNIFVCDLVHSLQDFQRYEAFFVIEDFPQKCLAKKYERNWFPFRVGEAFYWSRDQQSSNKSRYWKCQIRVSPCIQLDHPGTELLQQLLHLEAAICCLHNRLAVLFYISASMHDHRHRPSDSVIPYLWIECNPKGTSHAWKINNSIRVVITPDDFTESIRST